MKNCLCITFCVFCSFVYAQNSATGNAFRGTIKVKRNTVQLVKLDKKDRVNPAPSFSRTMSFRWGQNNYKEFFPKGYTSELFPLVFNQIGIFLVDDKRKVTRNTVISFVYEIYRSNTFA